MDNPKTKIVIFLCLTLALSAVSWVPLLRSGDLSMDGGLNVHLTMWCPGVAAVITRLITQRNLRGMGWSPRTGRLLGLAYVLPIIYATPVYVLTWAAGYGGFDPARWVLLPGVPRIVGLGVLMTAGVLGGLISAIGEEIGWRGLLVPELAKITRFRNTALVSGAVWAAWHLPLILGTNYRGEGTQVAFSAICFAAMIMALGVVMAWITIKSGSLWPAALLHSVHNLVIQTVLDGATVPGPKTAWLTGEFGIGLAVTVALAAALVLRFGGIPEGACRVPSRMNQCETEIA